MSDLAELIQGAMEMKAAQVRIEQRKFMALPNCIQESLFYYNVETAKKPSHNLLWTHWRVEMKPDAPHWRQGGIKDEALNIVEPHGVESARVILDFVSHLIHTKHNITAQEITDVELLLNKVINEVLPTPSNHHRSLLKEAHQMRLVHRTKQGLDDEDALHDVNAILAIDPMDELALSHRQELLKRQQTHAAKTHAMFAGKLATPGVRLGGNDDNDDDCAIPIHDITSPSNEHVQFANRLGLDLTDPAVRMALQKMSSISGKVVEMDLRKERERARSVRFWGFVIVLLIFVVAIFALLRATAIAQSQARRSPHFPPPPQSSLPPETTNECTVTM